MLTQRTLATYLLERNAHYLFTVKNNQNEAGRIIGDFSVTRLGPEEYFLVGAGSTERFHLRWWERRLPASGVELESMMTRLAGFAIAGPRARDLLSRLADCDVSSDALPFFNGRRMQVGPAPDVRREQIRGRAAGFGAAGSRNPGYAAVTKSPGSSVAVRAV